MTENRTKSPGLATRIFTHIVLLFLITASMGITTIWFSGRFDGMLKQVTGQGLELLQASRIMETALANQKGFVTYYFLDQDNKWLKELMDHRKHFQQFLEEALTIPQNAGQMRLLHKINQAYKEYIASKDEVIALYQAEKRQEGADRHWQVRKKFFQLNDLCRDYRRMNEQVIQAMKAESRAALRQVLLVTVGLVVAQFLVAAWLVFRLFSNVIMPIRQLSRKTRITEAAPGTGDAITELRESVYGLLDDRDRTRDELQQSKEMLLHSEKMALVGKLAPVVAHSIRNPMTSINMRLFSLQRNLDLTQTQEEDFAVILDEMQRLDHIVQNFLEFSRPHKLRKQVISVSRVMDMTLELLSYRLDLYNITVTRHEETGDLQVEADPELLKEVFVNLFVNACDAMENGGRIEVEIKEMLAENIGQAVMITVADNGPGMSQEVREKVLQPFETTKADGTGLGLYIAVKIIEEHGGTLELTSAEGRGTTFTIMLPGLEEVSE